MKSISALFRQLFLIVVLISAFSLSAWGETMVEMTTFSATSASMDNVISYSTAKGGGTSNPAINGNEIRLYQNSAGTGGGYITITAKENYTISSVTIGSSMATSVAHTIGSSTTKSSKSSLAKNGKHTISDINDQSVTIYCMGTTSSSRLYVNYLSVTYSDNNSDPEIPCTDPTISFTETTVTKTNREVPFTNTLTTNSSGAVTYTSSATNVAIVDNNGQVTIKGVGTTTITATVAADGTYCEAEASYTLTVEGRTFDITWMNGTDTHAKTIYTEGQPLTLPAQNPESCSDNYSTFVGWYTQQAGPTSNPSTELQGTEASKTDITGPTTFYAVFGDAGEGGSTTASLTEDKIKTNFTNDKCAYATGETYTDSENDIIWTSYGYTDANGRPWIQYKKDNDVYLQAETQQPVKKITLTITAAQNTAGGVTDIAKHTAYSSSGTITISDGTKTITTASGSTVSDNILEIDLSNNTSNTIRILTSTGCRIWNVELSFTSLSSSAYISICDGEEVIIPDDPTFNPAGGDFTETQQVTISAQDGASIYYTLNGNDPTTESIPYNGAIEISTTTTIKAIAVLNGVESSVSEAKYRINIVDDIAAFIEKQPTVETKILGTVTVVAQDQWKHRTWIQDANGSAMIDNSSEDVELTFGDQLKGIVGTFSSNNINVTSLPEKEATTATPTTKETKTINEITTDDLHKYIRIENVTFGGVSGSNATFTDETGSIKTYESYLQTDYSSINEGQKVNLNAIVGVFNNVPQIYVVSFDVVREPAIYADDKLDFGDVVENKELSKSTTITTVDLGESASVSISGKNASCFAVNTNTIEDNSETEITITFTAPEVNIETEYTATLEITGGEQIKEIALIASVYKAYTIKFGNTEKETNAEGKVTEIPTLDGVVGWTTNSVFAIVDKKPNVIDENTIFEENTQLYPVYSITEEGQEEAWTLVTDASTLAIGDEVVVTAANYNYAMSTEQRSNNRGSVEIAKSDNVITINDNVQTLTLEAGTQNGTFAFNTGSGYLYAASSESNHLKTQASIKANGSWSIEISNKIATIKAQENSRNWMRFNNSNDPKIFSCYASGQTDIALYKKTGGAITKYNIAGNKTVDNNTTFDVENNININTLTIKSNFDEAGEVNVTAGALSANKVIIEKTIGQTWCFFSLPYDCNVADVVATAGGATLVYAPDKKNGDYVIAEYKGGWNELLGTNNTLNANQGYIIGQFTDNTEVTVKFPSNGAQTISAPTTASVAKTSNNDFNLIGLPYYQKVNAELNVEYLSIPNEDGMTYNQTDDHSLLSNIAPFSSFFVETVNNIEFTIAAQQNAAPMMRANGVTNKAVVTLTDANGGVDKTTIINNPNNTTDYEIGHDLTKLIGYASIPQIYSHQGEKMLAFNSLAIDNSTVIPLGVYAHADGEYTFALNEKSMGDLQGWELYDNETGKTTRLANENLTIYLEQGTHEGRFEIRLQQRITTNCDNSMDDMTTWTANGTLNINNLPADAVVYIYDAVGRMIYVATPNANTFNYSFVARGVYNIVVRSADNTVSFKTIY